MLEHADPVVVEFPLRGERWVAVTSPADQLPSHGTDMLGQRYAFDFLRVDDRPGIHAHPAGSLRSLIIGGRTRDCYAWGAPIHAPFDGTIVAASDGRTERAWLHVVREMAIVLWNSLTFRPSRLGATLGNHVLMRHADRPEVFAGFAHIAPGTVAVQEGQTVATGDFIGRVGHTGNSTMPHLHFQLMDSTDLLQAAGIACAFRAYDVWRDGVWVRVERGVPGNADRIRSVMHPT
jgi:hypothetical protein